MKDHCPDSQSSYSRLQAEWNGQCEAEAPSSGLTAGLSLLRGLQHEEGSAAAWLGSPLPAPSTGLCTPSITEGISAVYFLVLWVSVTPETLKQPRARALHPPFPVSPFYRAPHTCNARSSQKPKGRNSRAVTLFGPTSLCPGPRIMSTVFDQWPDSFQIKYVSLRGACHCVSLSPGLPGPLELQSVFGEKVDKAWEGEFTAMRCCPYGRAGQVSGILGCWKPSVYSGGSRAVSRDSHPQA